MNSLDQYKNASYELAFEDDDFLHRRETRGLRLQMELMKPDLIQSEEDIYHTIVVFGSARFLDANRADALFAKALEAVNQKQPNAEALLKHAVQHQHNAKHYEMARDFSKIISLHYANESDPFKRAYICTGGGPGIMEAANRGAYEANAKSVGLNIALPFEQEPNSYITPKLCFDFHYFAIRKMHFMMRAKALVAFPGGFGTMDELFEVLTLIQTRKSSPTPVVLMNEKFWRTLVNFDYLVEQAVISAEDLALFKFFDDPQKAAQYLIEEVKF